jgi:CO dehydrogenase maturation factor
MGDKEKLKIAVAGKGGVGKTTIAGTLAVVEPGMRSVETVGRIKTLGMDIGIKNVAAVMNKVTDPEMVKMIETKLNAMDIPLLAIIPHDQALINADIENKAPLDVGGDAVEHIKAIKEILIDCQTNLVPNT